MAPKAASQSSPPVVAPTSSKPAAPEEPALPHNWPESLPFLRQPTHSDAITPAIHKTLHTPTKLTAQLPKFALSNLTSPTPAVLILPITAPTHPSYGQHGLFATRTLPPGTFILPYLGHYHLNLPTDTNPDSEYDISLDRELGISIDAEKAGNEARFINDYRKIGDRANAEFRDIWVQIAEGKWERWMGVFVVGVGKAGLRKKGVGRGEEIVLSYGKGFWDERKKEGGSGTVAAEAESSPEADTESDDEA